MKDGKIRYLQDNSEVKIGDLVRATIEYEGPFIFRVSGFSTITQEDYPEDDYMIGQPAVTAKFGFYAGRSWKYFDMKGHKFHAHELSRVTTQEKITYYIMRAYSWLFAPVVKIKWLKDENRR